MGDRSIDTPIFASPSARPRRTIDTSTSTIKWMQN